MREPVHLVAQAHELPREEEARGSPWTSISVRTSRLALAATRAGVRLDNPERVERRVLVVVEVRVQHEAVLVVVLVVVRVATLALGRRRQFRGRLVGYQFAEALDEPPVDGLLDADVVGFGQELVAPCAAGSYAKAPAPKLRCAAENRRAPGTPSTGESS